jgi:hypothetical protein
MRGILSTLIRLCSLHGSQAQEARAQPKTFNSTRMGITVVYPAILNREDPGDLKYRSYRSVFAMNPEADPDHTGLDPCSPLVIAFGMGSDKPRDPDAPAAKPGKQVPLAATGGITLSEITPKCMTAVGDQDMANLVGGIQRIDGMHPLSQIVSYKVQDVTVFFAAVTAFSKDEKGKRTASAGNTFIGSIGTIVHGHILLWSAVANDANLFNQLLKIKVCFDPKGCSTEQLSSLVPYELSSDKDRQNDAIKH